MDDSNWEVVLVYFLAAFGLTCVSVWLFFSVIFVYVYITRERVIAEVEARVNLPNLSLQQENPPVDEFPPEYEAEVLSQLQSRCI